MGTIIAEFSDGSRLEFDKGRFDSYCVFLVSSEGHRRAPLDTDYFQTLSDCAGTYSVDRIWRYFEVVYKATTNELDQFVVRVIFWQSMMLGEFQLEYQKAMTMVYAGMIAENNKAYTKLGKRIKKLGLHMLLKEEGELTFAANFMRGKNWREIDAMCNERGF